MTEKRGEPSNQYDSLNYILVAVSPGRRKEMQDTLKSYGFSKRDYSLAANTTTAKRMLEGKRVVITDDPGTAGRAEGIVIRADREGFSDHLRSTLEGKVDLYRAEASAVQGDKKKIIVVDYNEKQLASDKKTLEDLGYNITTVVDNGDEKVKEEVMYQAGAKGADLIVMNCEDELGTASGLTSLLVIKGFFPELPVIMRCEERKLMKSAFRYQADAAVMRYDPKELTDSIAKIFGIQPSKSEADSAAEEDLIAKLDRTATRIRDEMTAGQSTTPLSDGTVESLIEEAETSERPTEAETLSEESVQKE